MGYPVPSKPGDVRILILDDDPQSQTALHHVLDSEGWHVQIASLASQGMQELASGEWTLVIANVALTGLDGPTFETLKHLALAPAAESGLRRARVLFLVPEMAANIAQPVLERARLPHTMKPVNLHDFLEKVSDLMLEAKSIASPIRRVRYEHGGDDRRQRERRTGEDRRGKPMFASRDDYQMTEEEIAEFERQEAEEAKRKKAEREKA